MLGLGRSSCIQKISLYLFYVVVQKLPFQRSGTIPAFMEVFFFLFLGYQGGKMLYVQNVELAENIDIPTKYPPFLKQQSHVQKKQEAINTKK